LEREFQNLSLANGIRLHHYYTHRFKTVLFKFFLQRPLDEQAGLTALLPFVLRRGCARYPTSQALAQRLEELYGAYFDADVSKIGERQLIQFTLELPREDLVHEPGLVRQGLEILGQIITAPLQEGEAFREDYFQQEKNILLRKIDGLINDKPRYALQRLFEEMCPQEPFGISRYGDRQRVQGLTNGELYAHYRELLAGPADLFVVGPVPTAELQAAVEKIFPKGWQPAEFPPVTEGQAKGIEVVEEQDVRQGIIAMGLRTDVTYGHPGYPALAFYNGILGGFPHSKMFIEVRERASLAYFAYSRLEATKGLVVASAGIDVEKYQQAREIIQAQIDAMAAGQISDEEISATRRGLIHRQLVMEDSGHSLIDHRLRGLINDRPWGNRELIEAFEKVDKDQIIQVAQNVKLDVTYFLRNYRGEGK
jgi:predicted Zn-dependent peptidase